MAIANFVPEIWSAALLSSLRDNLVYGQNGVINRSYEGDIARSGDTVHITNFVDPSTRAYTKNNNITYDLLTDDTRSLVVDQSRYFAFTVDDIDKRQAIDGFIAETTRGASYNLAADADAYLSGLMVSGALAGNKLGSKTINSTTGDAYELLLALRTKLARSNTPANGRWVIVPPEMYAVLLQDDRFVRVDASGTSAGLRNGVVGRAAGFDVIESNTVPEDSSSVYDVVAGHGMSVTYAEQIASTEALRLENQFGDGIRGLHLYGAKVVRPALLATAQVTVSA